MSDNCLKTSFTKRDVNGLLIAIASKQNLNDWITNNYTDEIGNILRNVIFQDINNPDLGIRPLPEIIQSLSSLKTPDNIPENTQSFNPNYQPDPEKSALSPEADFINQGNMSSLDYAKMEKDFNREIMRAAFVTEEGELKNTKDVGKNLLEYRLNLAKKLWKYLYPTQEFPTNINKVQLVNSIISIFENITKTKSFNNYKNYYMDYMKLKHFDALLKKHFKFINKAPRYAQSSEIEEDTYTADSIFKFQEKGSAYDEDASSEDYASDFIKKLISCFDRPSRFGGKVSLDFASYTTSLQVFYKWAESQSNDLYKSILYSGIQDFIDNNNPNNLIYLLEKFCNDPANRRYIEIKNVIKGVIDIFKNNKLDTNIKIILANLINTEVGYNYIAVRMESDRSTANKRGELLKITTKLLEGQIINGEINRCKNSLINKIMLFRENYSEYNELKAKYGIKVERDGNGGKITINAKPNDNESQVVITPWKASDTNGIQKIAESTPITVKITLSESGGSPTYKFNRITDKTSGLNVENMNPEFVINFINDFTGLSLDETDINAFHEGNSGNLFSTFATMAYIVITASEGNSINQDTGGAQGNAFNQFKWLFDVQPVLDNYYDHLTIPADYLASKYGTENRTVMKNGEGNNLPTSQLRSSIYDFQWKIYSMKNPENLPRRNNMKQETASNPYSYNLLYNQSYTVGSPVTRSDIKIGNKTKQVQNLTLKECLDWAVLNDFYFNLFSEINNPNQEYDKAHNPFFGKILIQVMEYADKKRHFIIPFDINKIVTTVNGETKSIRNVLRDLGNLNANTETRNKARNFFLMDFFNRTGSKYREIARRMLLRYSDIYDLGYSLQNLQTNQQIQAAKTNIESKLKGKSQYDILADANKKHIDIYNESDFDLIKKTNQFDKFNSTLFYLTDISSDFNKFSDFIKSNQILGIKSMIKTGFTLDGSINPSLNSYLKSLAPTSEFRSWIDPVTNEIDLVHVFDSQGNKVNIDSTNIDELDKVSSGEYSWIINPIIESYLLSDIAFSNYYTDIAVGDVYGFAAKHKLQIGHPDYMEEDLGSRYLMMTKRAVPMGGTRITFTQGLNEGVPDKMNLAVVEDTIAPVFNHMGNSDNYTSQDGAAWKSSYFSRMQNASLPGREGGNRRMKTLCNWTDRETCTMGLLKFAEYTITNEDRRNSVFSDISLESLFKRMHSMNIPNIDLEQYYSQQTTAKSFGKTIYRQLPETKSLYDKLVKIEKNPGFDQVYIATWERRNFDGTTQLLTESYDTSTLYGLDQLFGGAYAGELDSNNRFKYSELNIDLVYKIICEENIKHNFIHMMVNHSSIKAGVKNLNPNSSLYDESELRYFEVPTKQYGMQGNKDHEVDDPRGVREMSQLINSLTQDDLMPDAANELYGLIGNVVSNALGEYRTALVSNNPNEVYKLLGKAFVKSMAQNGRSSLGLASAFAANATNDLLSGELKRKIPFSANTLKGIFQAAISSTLNNDALMRRFAGMGGVETPSYGMLQYFEINGKKLNANELLRLVGNRDMIKAYMSDPMLITDANGNITSNNPYVIPVTNQNKFGFEDTIIVIRDDGTWEYIKIDTVEKRDYYLNSSGLVSSGRIFNWTIKPKNLKGSETFVTVNGIKYSIFDFDVPRAVSYLRQKGGILSLDSVQKTVILEAINELRNAEVIKDEEILDIFNKSYIDLDSLDEIGIKKLENRLVWYILNNLDPKLQEATNFTPIEFKTQQAWNNPSPISVIDNSWTQSTEGAIGKRDAKKLGIRLGDTINDIKDQKEQFFKQRLRELMPDPKVFGINPRDYDAVLYTTEGNPIFVVIGRQDSRRVLDIRERIGDKLKTNLDFPILLGEYWNGDSNYGSSENKIFKSYQTSNGKLDYVFVDDYNAFDELVYNDSIIDRRLNYNSDNFGNLMSWLYGKDGIARFKGTSYEVIEKPDGNLDVRVPQDISVERLIQLLNIDESKRINRRINKLAENRYKSAMMLFQAIMDRIPSQSLQSCAAIDIVMLLDTFDNVANISHMLAWLQGSDFDIDVEYTLFYELGDNGVVITPSFLDRYYDPEDVLSLPIATGNSYTFDSNIPGIVLNAQDYRMFNLGSILPIKKVLESGQQNIQFDGLTEEQAIDFEKRLDKFLKIHERSVKASENKKAAGLRNMIVYRLNKFLKSPIIQGRREISVDTSMSAFRDAIPEEKNGQEVKRSPFNPVSKFETQVSNMSGKDGVGIGAAGEKNYFIAHRTHSADLQLINQLINEYSNNPSEEIAKQILDNLQFVVTNAIFRPNPDSSDIRAIANLSIKRAFGNYNKPNIIVPEGYQFGNRSSILGNRYVLNGEFLLSKLLEDLDIVCNGIPDNMVNATNAHSGNISLATDNAKYLDLDKMNNTSKFGDIYVYLISSGISPNDMVKFMTSPVFDICAKFSNDDISNPNTAWFNLENAVDFVLDKKTLPIIKDKIFAKAIFDGETKASNNEISTSFIYDFFTNPLIRNLDPLMYIRLMNRVLNGMNVQLTYSTNSTELFNQFVEEFDKLRKDGKTWSFNSQQILKNIYNILENYTTQVDASGTTLGELSSNILLKNLRTKFVNAKALEKPQSNNDYDNIESLLEEAILQSQYEDDGVSDTGDINNYFNVTQNFTGRLSSKELQNAYKYVKNYLIPKNKLVSQLVDNQWKQKLEMLAEVIKAVSEMKANSNLLGINSKGLTTNDFEEYSKIESFNKYINSRYLEKKDFVPFDLVKFLLDENEQQIQIKQYEQVKSSENILHNLLGTDHFREMLTALAVNRQLIGYCTAIDLERKLAKKIVKINSDPNILSEGDTKSLSNDEFREVQRYVSDLLISRWIQTQNNLDIYIPKGQSSYSRETGSQLARLTKTKAKRLITINNLDGLASFKRLMDLYIIPKLKSSTAFSKNPFIQNLKLWYDLDKKTVQYRRGFGFDFDTKLIDDSPVVEELFNSVMKGFNEIKNRKLSDSIPVLRGINANYPWTIGELFWLYNLVTYKDGFGNKALTKVFEDLNLNSGTFSVMGSYYDFLGKLDSKEIDSNELFKNELRDSRDKSDSKIDKRSEENQIKLKDLRYRVASDINGNKIKTTLNIETDKGRTKVIGVNFFSGDDIYSENKVSGDQEVQYSTSDYTLNMPFTTGFIFEQTQLKPEVKKVGEQIKIQEWTKNPSVKLEVYQTISEFFQNKFGFSPIKFVRNDDFNNPEFRDKLGIAENEIQDYTNTNGFIHENDIYINIDNANLSTPIHEYMHIVMALMKYSANTKAIYYNLINKINDLSKSENEYSNLINAYQKKYPNTWKEEVLVQIIGDKFRLNLESDINKLNSSKEWFINDVLANIKDMLTNGLGIDGDIDNLIAEFKDNTNNQSINISDLPINLLFNMLGTKKFGAQTNADGWKRALGNSEYLQYMKNKLNITYNGDC